MLDRSCSRWAVILIALIAGACADVATPPAPAEQGFVPVDGEGRLYYEVRGTGSAVVLLHGGNTHHGMWDDQFDAFAQDYRVVRYDIRGFGQSSSPEVPHRQWEDLRALFEHLDIERAHLVGLSLGGRIAIDFALEYPQRVDRLVLAGPGLSGWDFEPAEWMEETARALQAGDKDAACEAWLRSPFLEAAMENPELAVRLRELAFENQQSMVPVFKGYRLTPPAIERLGDLSPPTLLILGSRDVEDIRNIVDRMALDLPDARKVLFDGAGHMVNMEQPDDFNRTVLAFLAGPS